MDSTARSIEWVRKRYEEVQTVVATSCQRVGRNPHDVRTIAVTKYIDPPALVPLVEAGIRAFGENRWQQAKPKLEMAWSVALEWHFIGHLQQNKVSAVVRHFDWIHSVDSAALIDSISRAASQNGRTVQCLVQVNVSGESSKQGLAPEKVQALVQHSLSLPNVEVRGLMTMAPLLDHPEETRPVFHELRNLQTEVRTKLGICAFDQLSMGMSGDYPVAVEEGATLIRIGRSLVLPLSEDQGAK